ncbi:hypothetical protein MIDIC_10065 [Alphaproteobacteria bacterium]
MFSSTFEVLKLLLSRKNYSGNFVYIRAMFILILLGFIAESILKSPFKIPFQIARPIKVAQKIKEHQEFVKEG